MCIRDRGWVARRGAGRGWGPGGGPAPPPAGASSAAAPAAVSYTHLRAHETVLDLVCRLLLEKTNKEIENTSLL